MKPAGCLSAITSAALVVHRTDILVVMQVEVARLSVEPFTRLIRPGTGLPLVWIFILASDLA